jgi:tetratricopeptide (TPR) repeat protein
VRTLTETQVLVGELGAYRLEQDLPTLQVPATIQTLLAARMDRLPQSEKRLLQIAAVIGTEVPFGLLQPLAEVPEEVLYQGLAHLQAAEFLDEMSLFPEKVYTFKHTLTQEVAYGSLLQDRRRGLHARIVEALEALVGSREGEQIERLAHHALRGEVWDKVLEYCRQAGQTAARRGAYQEAVTFYEQTLHALQHLPPTSERLAQAIDLHLALQDALFPLGAYSRSVVTLREAERLAETLGDQQRLGWVAAELSGSYRQINAYGQAVALAHRALALAVTIADDDLHAWAALRLGQVFYFQGDYQGACDGLREAITCSAGAEDTEESTFLPAHARSWLVYCLAQRGKFGEGLALGTEAAQFAEAGNFPTSLCATYASCGYLTLLQGDLPHAMVFLERGIDLCHRWHNLDWFPECVTSLSLVYALAGRVADACSLVEQASAQDATMAAGYKAIWLNKLGQSFLLVGRLAEAKAQAKRALRLSHERRERGFQAWSLWLLGDIAMHGAPLEIEQAETHYHQALALANELGMRPLQAHCHRGLGTLYRQTGQPEQARAELITAMEMYRDMEMTFWLPETEAALAAVEGR